MLDPLFKNLLQGITIIEDDFGAVNKIISKQLGTYAITNGKTVCFLEPPAASSIEGGDGELNGIEMPETEALENTGSSAQKNTIIYRTEERYLPLEELKFDMVVFDSFSSHIFGMSEKEVVDLIEELVRLSRRGKTFVLTTEAPMLTERVNAYIRATADTVIMVRVEIGSGKINRTLYIPKMLGIRPMDRLVKITLEEGGADIDTREFVG